MYIHLYIIEPLLAKLFIVNIANSLVLFLNQWQVIKYNKKIQRFRRKKNSEKKLKSRTSNSLGILITLASTFNFFFQNTRSTAHNSDNIFSC